MAHGMRNFKQKSRSILVTILLLVSGIGAAQAPVLPERLIDRYEIGELRWSPDGQRLAVVVTEPVSGEGQAVHIWIYEADGEQLRQLTVSGEKNRRPRWSPDGKSLAYISSRTDETTQIYLLPMNGGEAQPITDDGPDVVSFEWSPDGDSIAFVSGDPEPESDEEQEEDKDDEIVVSESVKPMHLRLVDIDTGDTRPLTRGNWRVSDFAWRPDGAGLVVSATDNFSMELLTDRFFTVELDGKDMTELARPDGPVRRLTVSPDNRFLAYIGSTEGGPIPHGLFLQPLQNGGPRNLTDATLDRMIGDYAWADDGSIWALAVDGFGDQLVQLSMDGTQVTKKTFPDQSVTAFDVAGSTIALVSRTAVDPQEIWISDVSDPKQVTQLNNDFPALIGPEIIHYVAEGGVTVEAALFKPTGKSRPRKGRKTVLLVHGGPASRWSHRINDWAQLLVSRGYVVIAPNIRGSIGYGLAYIRSNRYDWGGADYRDAIAGVDYLIEKGISDPEQIAVAGWSYGGYISAWAITQTDRFKAAVVGAAMTDLAVEYGTETAEINAYDTWYLGTPYENLNDFIRMSPMTFVKNARTPALILVGEDDKIDPVGQSWQFYRALRRYGVDSELVIYPREPHSIKERNHRIDLMTRMVDWIESHTK